MLTAFKNGCDTEHLIDTDHAMTCDPAFLPKLLRDALSGLKSVHIDTNDEDLMSDLQHAFACAIFAALDDWDVNNIMEDWEVETVCLP